MPDTPDRRIAALATRQRGFVTRAQLLELGLGEDAVDYRLSIGRLIRVHAGVYAVGHLPPAPVDRAAAAVLACGPTAVLSHASAATLWGIRRTWPDRFEVTGTGNRRRRGLIIHRSYVLVRGDIRRHLGVRVTSPARTLLDYAPRLTDARLTRAVNDLRLAGYLSLSDLADAIARLPRRRGAPRLRRFVEDPTGPTRSRFEDAFVEFARRFRLPEPQINARVAGYEVDALFAEQRVIVELDGYRFHSSREDFERDRERDAETAAAGHLTVRLTWERLTRAPRHEAERLRRILARPA